MATSERFGSSRRAPAEGERASRRGYRHQDRASARLVYAALAERRLRWIGLADRGAGDVDDLVLGLSDEIVAHQFKKSLQPSGFGIQGLLLGAGREIASLATAYGALVARHAGTPVRIRYFTNDYPSVSDHLIKGDTTSTTANFVSDWMAAPRQSLKDWRATRWQPVFDELAKASGLTDPEFEAFWLQLELICGAAASIHFEASEDKERERQIEDLSRAIGTLVADNPEKDQWSRDELLVAIGWPDRFSLRFTHTFPIGAWVQRNGATESRLAAAISTTTQGYLSLVGPPGAGKSTLLARQQRDTPQLRFIRYLAFVPGTAQGQGRGEADALYHDLSTQLLLTGLDVSRLKDDTTHARRQHFEQLLAKAGDRFVSGGTRTVIVIDGLDHVPREESPNQSLLTALPLPQAIPDGVLFVLGTQRLDLPGMPPAVMEQADSDGRRINIDPLMQSAVAAMADSAGLDRTIARDALYRVGGGHPLVTRYLIERLLRAEPSERAALLGGEFGEGGDLEAVYRAAWRWIDRSADPHLIKQVLALVSHAQGPIEPELLAKATSEAAVEAALKAAGHLLLLAKSGWSAFHNSFRLFVQRQPVQRFGKPHPDFTSEAIYRRLGGLVRSAATDSLQRWLDFRYAYLAGDHAQALGIATRNYFVAQYIGGRDLRAVRGDISDAYRLLEAAPDVTKLFEMMLAQDEVERRASIMESASALVDASIELGDLDAARGALDDIHEDGKQWLVVDALVEDGRIDDARLLFESHTPFRERDGGIQIGIGGEFERRFKGWLRHAVMFLDAEQIESELAQILAAAEPGVRSDFEARAGEAIAIAFIDANPGLELDGLCARWCMLPHARLRIAITGAEAAFEAGYDARASELLGVAISHSEISSLHPSWSLSASRVALRIGDRALAERFLVHAPLCGPGDLGPYQSERLEGACYALIRGIIVRTALGIPFSAPKAPSARLLLGIQHHLVAISTAVGGIRAGRSMTASTVEQLATSALNYLASARELPGEDDLISHRLPTLGRIVVELLYALSALAHLPGATVARIVDRLIGNGARFRHWQEFRRTVALRAFELDRDEDDAAASLELALADLNCSDPREEVEQRTQFAADFARIGRPMRARELLASLRGAAFGTYLPAKKDGQYEMWVDLLARANRADPGGMGRRGTVMLHFVEGMEETEGYDMARRMVRQVLYEAAAADVETAAMGLGWAMTKGSIAWDGVVDALLRGLVAQKPARYRDALVAWCSLCLPWYGEPHGSTLPTGSFLTDLLAAAEAGMVAELEAEAATAIETLAPSDIRLRLLRVLETAAAKRGGGALVRQKVEALAVVEPREQETGTDPRNRSYSNLVNLSQVTHAVEEELAYSLSRPGSAEEAAVEMSLRKPSWNLRAAATQLIANSAWPEVATLAERHPQLMTDPNVALAAARVAVAAGERAAAETLLANTEEEGREGWAWPSDPTTLRRHEARHLLGLPNAHRSARRDFLGDLASRRHGVAGMLWSTERIFPLLFPEVPWPAMWDLLEPQIRTTRDFARGGLLERLSEEGSAKTLPDDDRLLAELFVQALTMDVSLLGDCAARGAHALLEQGNGGFFAVLVECLLGRPDGAMHAADLLSRTADNPEMRRYFAPRLATLAAHGDVAVVAAALLLSERWNYSIAMEPTPLPAFYQLHLPPSQKPNGKGAVDARTGGMVLEDSMGWTHGWDDEVHAVANAGGVSAEHVRWRVGQLIQDWGGIARFGHAGTMALESRLARLGLKMPYRRPHIIGVLQALRCVVAELFHAARIDARALRRLLRILFADPDQPTPPASAPRPDDTPLVRPPRIYHDEDRAAWLDAVETDVSMASPCAVLVDLQVTTSTVIRSSMVVETYAASALDGVDEAGVGATTAALPGVRWMGGARCLYEKKDAHSSRVARFYARRIDRLPEELIVLCPYAAQELGWRNAPGSADRYVDADGAVVAWTIWWRDGLPQPTNEDEFRAEGQRVCLSTEGLAKFEALYGPVVLQRAAWRRVYEERGEGAAFRFARSDEILAPTEAADKE